RLERIIGAASAQTRRWVGACRQAANSRDIASLQNSRPLYRSSRLGVGRSRYGNASIEALEAGKPDEMLGGEAGSGYFSFSFGCVLFGALMRRAIILERAAAFNG